MGLLSDFLLSPVGEVGYGAMAELYDQANIRAEDKQRMFQGLGDDLRVKRRENQNLFEQKLSNFNAMELDFINNIGKWDSQHEGKSEADLKALFAPMGNYLAKGDTFVGKPDEVRTKVMQLFQMSGGFKKDDTFVTKQEFIDKTKAAISSPIEKWSGLGYNTYENQVGSLAYKPAEFEALGTVDNVLRLTAANYPMWFQNMIPFGGDQMAILDLTRLNILNYNARKDATDESGLNIGTYIKLKTDRLNYIENKSPQPIDQANILRFMNINENQLNSLMQLDTTFSATIENLVGQIANKKNSNPNYIGSSEYITDNNNLTSAIVSSLNEQDNILNAIKTKDWQEVPEDVEMAESIAFQKLQSSFNADDANAIYQILRAISENSNLAKEPIVKFDDGGNLLPPDQASGALAVYLAKNGGVVESEGAPGTTVETEQIPGRIAEAFTFITVPQEEGKPAKWVAVSKTGVMFDLSGVNYVRYVDPIEGKRYFPDKEEYQDVATVLDFNPTTNRGLNELRAHAEKVIAYAMNNKIKLNFMDPNYLARLENAGIFGLDTTSRQPIKYFGKTDWVKITRVDKERLR